jgi:hypothetical protein
VYVSTRNIDEMFLGEHEHRHGIEKFVRCEIASVYAALRDMCDSTEMLTCWWWWEYNESYDYFRERVARRVWVCYIE